MDFLPEAINDYVHRHTASEPEVLAELNRDTNLKILNPRMLAGHLQGRVIATLSHMIRPENVLEIGTYTGYSALCWAEGLQDEGTIHTIDINEELEDYAQAYFNKAGVDKKIQLHIGNALEIIPSIDLLWDVVFIDADKSNYVNYFDLTIDRIKSGGYLIADNVLWSGKVLEKQKDLDTQQIDAFNKKVHNDPRVENVLFPIRDGLMVCRKR